MLMECVNNRRGSFGFLPLSGESVECALTYPPRFLELGAFMASSNKTYKAFVSSTFIDLKEHRAHVINSLRNAGFFADPMENWTADSDEPKKFSQDRLDGCDLCVLLVAFRRGFVPEGETRSITQMEYDTAVKDGIDILPFVLDEVLHLGPGNSMNKKKTWASKLGARI